MQGTIVMLMALSGLGCHHKSCDVVYVPSYHGAGACSGTGYAHDGWGPSSGGYDGCHAGGAVGRGSSRFPCHGCLLSGLFYCFGGWGGSWKQGHGHFGGCHRAYETTTMAAITTRQAIQSTLRRFLARAFPSMRRQ